MAFFVLGLADDPYGTFCIAALEGCSHSTLVPLQCIMIRLYRVQERKLILKSHILRHNQTEGVVVLSRWLLLFSLLLSRARGLPLVGPPFERYSLANCFKGRLSCKVFTITNITESQGVGDFSPFKIRNHPLSCLQQQPWLSICLLYFTSTARSGAPSSCQILALRPIAILLLQPSHSARLPPQVLCLHLCLLSRLCR